ncbi:hypothetical protein A0O28_0027590 [Trichoderma guizhouense]|uniref:Uncharacterized protein n=1 Tax=Trichoderma guizhouense TaxID=1491466 RepID=A0A1T3CTQ1_9HYPO|nr:hypothetical protein A0O28_0027590 [Trichoderma guizhouense]
MTTVADFLLPPLGPLELDYVVLVKVSEYVQRKYDSANISGNAQKKHDGSDNSRYPPLADLQEFWLEFDVENISSRPSIAACLKRPCMVRWEPQIPRFARVVYSERQLEALFLQTLITRVNIALENAIPPNEERIAILVGPPAFESVSAEGTVQRLYPDWIVVQGDFDIGMGADVLPVIMDLAREGKILAVGDTKLVRKGGSDNVSPTKACNHEFLRQLQAYCINLYTRFGFILSNEELVVVQVMAAKEASPRKAEQRGLRSNGGHQLEPGLGSQGTDSLNSMDQDGYDDDDASMSGFNDGGEEEDNPFEDGLPPLLSPSRKRPYPSTSPGSSPVAGSRRFRNPSLSGSDISSHRISFHQISSHQINSYQIPSDPPGSDPFGMEASQTLSSQGHSSFAPSVRSVEAGVIQIRSFDMKDWGNGGESPYRVMFMFVMMIRALKLQQQPIHILLQE